MSQNIENGSAGLMAAEMNMRYLIFYVFKKWRMVFLVALIFVAVALLVTTAGLIMEMTDAEYEDIVAKEYNDSVLDYTDKMQTLERTIVTLEDDLVWQEAYNQASVLMKIDPDHKMIATMTYYIDADEQVVPDYLEQYVSRTGSLLKAYMLYLSGGDLYNRILERFPEMNDIKYIKEIVSATMYDTTGMITLTVIGNDDETAQTIFGIVRAGMAEVYREASESIGEHELIELDSNVYTYQDLSLANRQQSNLEAIFTLNTQIRETKLELNALEEEFKELTFAPLWRRITVQMLKTAVYAALGGIVVMLVLLALYYTVSGKILDSDKLRCIANLSVLGSIPGAGQKRIRILDRAAAAMGGVKLKTAERETALALTAQSICTTVSAKGITEGGIALAGSVAEEELRAVAEAFNEAAADTKLRFVAAGNPMCDVASVEAVKAAAIVVVVEKQGVSLCADVVKEADRITAWGKPVLGVVLLDADAA